MSEDEQKYADRPHPTAGDVSLRHKLSTADLSAFIQQIPGKGQADYVPHGVIRALLIKSGLDYDWTVDTFNVEGGWQAGVWRSPRGWGCRRGSRRR